jgi:hypothetical protein
MSAEQKPALRRIRTFAQDAAAAQGKSTDTTSKETTTSSTSVAASVSVPTEKAAAAKVFATQTPTEEQKPAPPAAPVVAHEAHIPAFHELQKKASSPEIAMGTAHSTPKIPTLQAEAPKKVTVRAKKHDLHEKVSVSGGTIITDTKRNELNFFDALIASINNWFTSLNKKLTEKKTPTYTVRDTELRKGVIQKATSKTGSIFTADSETLKEEIRRRNQTVTPTPHHTDITWSPQTEPGFALLEDPTQDETPSSTPVPPPAPRPVVPPAPKIERVVVEFKKKTLPAPVITQPSTPEPVIIPEPEPVPPAPVAPEDSPVIGYDAYTTPKVAEATFEPAPLAEIAEPAPVFELPEEEAAPAEEIVEPMYTEPVPRTAVEQGNIFAQTLSTIRQNTNTLTLSITGFVVAILLIVFVVKVLVGALLPGTPSTSAPTASALLASSTVTDLSLPSLTTEQLIESLKTVEVITNTPKEIRLTNSTNLPLSTQDTLRLVGFGDSNFMQTVSEVHLVTINAQRGILVKVTDPTAAFGSLLIEEPNMAERLQTYLGFTKPSTNTSFSDTTIGNSDIRVLATDGKELIVYGFISGNTLLITEDSTSFKSILGSH